MKILSATSIMFPSLSSTRYDRTWIILQLQTGYVVGKSSDLFIFDLPEEILTLWVAIQRQFVWSQSYIFFLWTDWMLCVYIVWIIFWHGKYDLWAQSTWCDGSRTCPSSSQSGRHGGLVASAMNFGLSSLGFARAKAPRILFLLTHYNLTSVCIFSILFSVHFLRHWWGEFVYKSRAF